MERNLLLGSVALGLTGWLAGVLLSRTSTAADMRAARRGLAIGLIIILVVAAKAVALRVLWPAAYPWALGASAGGLAAWLAALTADRADAVGRGAARGAAVAAPMFLAVAVSSAAAVWMRPVLVETLLGIGFGWLAVGIAIYIDAFARGPQNSTRRLASFIPNLGFAITLPAAITLATFRDAASQTTAWSTALIVLAVGVPLALVLVASFARQRDAGEVKTGSIIIVSVLASVALAALAALIGIRLLAQPRLVIATAVGLVTSLLVWWLVEETAAEPIRDLASGLPTGSHALAALTALGGVIAGFYVLIGYGVAVAMLAAWLPAAVAVVTSDRASWRDQAAIRTGLILMLGVVILLYRVFVQRFDADLTGATLTDHFAIFAFVAGLVIPGLLGRILTQPWTGTGRLFFSLMAAYALMALVPATALALWGSRAALGLLAGFAASAVVYAEAPAAAGVAAGISLLLAQWGHHAVSVIGLTRDERVKIIIVLAVVTAIVLVAADLLTRAVGRTPNSDAPERSTKGAHS